jgi:hypothetical protein
MHVAGGIAPGEQSPRVKMWSPTGKSPLIEGMGETPTLEVEGVRDAMICPLHAFKVANAAPPSTVIGVMT